MPICVYSVIVLSFVEVETLRRADPHSRGLRNLTSGQGPTEG
jgi:hypothetical protein